MNASAHRPHWAITILRERLHDFEDLARRLQRHLDGNVELDRELPKDAVLVARAMGPAELLDYASRSV